MKAAGVKLSHDLLAKILSGANPNVLNEIEIGLSFYGLMEGKMKYTKIRETIKPYFDKHFYSLKESKTNSFFDAEIFNHFTEQSKQNLILVINTLPILKTEENLTDSIKEIRKTHPRSHESWNELETIFIKKAFENTNDLTFLSKAFQRSESSIRAMYGHLIGE